MPLSVTVAPPLEEIVAPVVTKVVEMLETAVVVIVGGSVVTPETLCIEINCSDMVVVVTDDLAVTSGQVADIGVDAHNVCKEQQINNVNIKICSLFFISSDFQIIVIVGLYLGKI
jgi:hypothetical protein